MLKTAEFFSGAHRRLRSFIMAHVEKSPKKRGSNPPSGEFASLGSPGSSSGQQQPSSSSPGRGLFLVSGAALLSSLQLMMELDPRLYENVVRSFYTRCLLWPIVQLFCFLYLARRPAGLDLFLRELLSLCSSVVYEVDMVTRLFSGATGYFRFHF